MRRMMHLPVALASALALGVIGMGTAHANPGSAERATSFTLFGKTFCFDEAPRSDFGVGTPEPIVVGKTLSMGAVTGVPCDARLSAAQPAEPQPESLLVRLIRELRARLASHGETDT